MRLTAVLLGLGLLAGIACGSPPAPSASTAATQTAANPTRPSGAPNTAAAATSVVAPAAQPAADEDAVTGDVVVFAASSLTDAFKDIGAEFRRLHPAARVVLSFGGSSQLAIQLINGAHPDVFASADQAQMDAVERAHALVGAQHDFIRNRLMLIAPRDNPARIAALADLARPGVKIIGAQASVPIGAYTTALLRTASADPTYGADFQQRVEQNVVSREDTVRQVVGKIQLGEADAAVVYATDVTPAIADQFVRIPLPDALQVIATYPIAVTAGHNRAGAEAFVAFVQSPAAQAIFTTWGFLQLDAALQPQQS